MIIQSIKTFKFMVCIGAHLNQLMVQFFFNFGTSQNKKYFAIITHGMSVKYEEPLNELTVQVWLLYHHPNFNYWTVCKRYGITDRQTI